VDRGRRPTATNYSSSGLFDKIPQVTQIEVITIVKHVAGLSSLKRELLFEERSPARLVPVDWWTGDHRKKLFMLLNVSCN
jgi:hypothetical protein